MSLKRFTGYRDVDDQLVYEGCKVEIMDGDHIHKGYIVEEDGSFNIAPGFEGGNTREPLEDHVEGDIFQGRVIEYANANTGIKRI